MLNVIDKVRVKELWISKGSLTNPSFIEKLRQANKYKTKLHIVQKNDRIPIFDSSLQFLSSGYTGKGDNNDSLVSYGKFFGLRFLFTGDLEAPGEKELLHNYPKLRVDILKVGHHGSKSSSSYDFIAQIKPKVALISVGKNNRYKHPNQKTLRTLKANHVKIFRTDQSGAVQIRKNLTSWQLLKTRK